VFARDGWCEVQEDLLCIFPKKLGDIMHLKVMHSFDILDIKE